MDTKLKNKYLPTVSLILSIYLLGFSFLAAADIISHRVYLKKDYYFTNYQFQDRMSTFIDLFITYYRDYQDYSSKSIKQKIGEERYTALTQNSKSELEKLQKSIHANFILKINEATKAGNSQLVTQLQKDRDQQLLQAEQENKARLDQLLNGIVAKMDDGYWNTKHSLEIRSNSIKFYIKDHKTLKTYSNLPSTSTEALQNEKNHSLYSTEFTTDNWDAQVFIPAEISGSSQIHADYQYYLSIRERIIKEVLLGIISLGFGIALLVYLTKKEWLKLRSLPYWDKLKRWIPLDIRAFLCLLVAIILATDDWQDEIFYLPPDFSQLITLTFTSLLLSFLLLNGIEAVTLYRNRELLQEQWNLSLTASFLRLVKGSLANTRLLIKVLVFTGLTALLGCFFIILLSRHSSDLQFLAVIYILFYLVAVVPYVLKQLNVMITILQGTKEIAAGNLNYVITETGSGNLSSLITNINNMKTGFKKSLESQMKSERLKSELITNVSHDLKTPLTSIINYVNLLKREDLPPSDVEKYVEILDRKAQRLKILIDDLFEASKMASGSVELDIETADVAALLTQALAEYDDKIENSSLTFRVKTEHPKMFAQLDGKKTWRVFENLISNALKYSLPHTRVYISITEQPNTVILTIQNTSAYEIDFDVEEIFERFKRGDQSRNTEGSGLGLAIAKSIMELQNGDLQVVIDGDHFKAIATFQK